MDSPLVRCVMLTYGRYMGEGDKDHTILVEEALESFLKQDYPNKELIILNDTPGQTVHFDHPEVKVFNSKSRYLSLGIKRNEAVSKCSGEYVFVWDDDDIMLPWRLSQGVEWFCEFGHDYCGSINFWFSTPNSRYHTDAAPGTGAMCSAAYRKSAIDRVPYRDMNSGEDQQLLRDMRSARLRLGGGTCDQAEAAVIYRWDYLARHISGMAPEIGYQRLGKTRYPAKDIYLNPRWQHDYVTATKACLT